MLEIAKEYRDIVMDEAYTDFLFIQLNSPYGQILLIDADLHETVYQLFVR